MGCCETKDSHEFVFKEASNSNFNNKEKDAIKYVFDEINPNTNNHGDYLNDFENTYSNNEPISKRIDQSAKKKSIGDYYSKEDSKNNPTSNQTKNSAYNRAMNFSFQNGSIDEIEKVQSRKNEKKDMPQVNMNKVESNIIVANKNTNENLFVDQLKKGKAENNRKEEESTIQKKKSLDERCQNLKKRIIKKSNSDNCTPEERVERMEKNINNNKYGPIQKANSITTIAKQLQEQMLKGPNKSENKFQRMNDTVLAVNQKPVIHKTKKELPLFFE